MLKPEWIEWAKNLVMLTKDGGYVVYPLDGKGVVFRLDKANRKLITLCEHPTYHGSDTDKTNHAVFKMIGYSVVRADNTPTNLQDTIAKVHREGGLALIDGNAVSGLATIFQTKPSVVDRMLHQATGNKEPINPITIRGYRSHTELIPRCLGIGRIYLSTMEPMIQAGQHKFDPTKPSDGMDHLISFMIFEENPVNIFAYMIGNENHFLPQLKAFRSKTIRQFVFDGIVKRGVEEKRSIVFSRLGENLLVNIHEGDNYSPILSTVMMDYCRFDRGLDHLFVKGELAILENN